MGVETLRNDKGFTLVELLIVLSLLAIIAAVTSLSMVGQSKDRSDREAKAAAVSVASDLEGRSVREFKMPATQSSVTERWDRFGTSRTSGRVFVVREGQRMGSVVYVQSKETSRVFAAWTWGTNGVVDTGLKALPSKPPASGVHGVPVSGAMDWVNTTGFDLPAQ